MKKRKKSKPDPFTLPVTSLSLPVLGSTVTVLNGPVLAQDKDIGPNAVMKYLLLGARVDLFTVDANTGNILTPQEAHTEESCSAAGNVSVSASRSDSCASGGQVGPRGLSGASCRAVSGCGGHRRFEQQRPSDSYHPGPERQPSCLQSIQFQCSTP